MKLPRKTALVVAGLVSVASMGVGSAAIVMGGPSGLASSLACSSRSGTDAAATQVQYDDTYAVVVDTTTSTATTAADSSSDGVATGDVPSSDSALGVTESPSESSSENAGEQSPQQSAPRTSPHPVAAPPVTTVPPTLPPVTTVPKSRDREEGSAAHSSGSIPPMPAGCVGGELEDNGVWNCQH